MSAKLYLLDANILIDANRDYYPISRVPEFWEWLVFHGKENRVKIPIEIYEEIKKGDDELTTWLNKSGTKSALLLQEDVNERFVARVIDEGYASDLTDDEVEKLGNDPFLIAYALGSAGKLLRLYAEERRCVVTSEVSRPKRKRANRQIPDVCKDFNISCCDTFELIKVLDFSTDWKRKL